MTERHYTATQDNPPKGPWHMRLEQDGKVIEDDCDHDHKASAREDLERRLDAMIDDGLRVMV